MRGISKATVLPVDHQFSTFAVLETVGVEEIAGIQKT